MISLVGCIVPRLRVYWRGFRARAAARRRGTSAGCPESRRFELDEDADAVLARARAVLRKKRYRVVRPATAARCRRGARLPARGRQPAVPRLGAGRAGRLRLRPAVRLQGRRGHRRRQRLLQLAEPVRRLRARAGCSTPTTCTPLSLKVDDFHVKFLTSGPQHGPAGVLRRRHHLPQQPGRRAADHDLAVNHPLTVDGASVFLVGHGYAPVVTVRDGNGKVAYPGRWCSCRRTRRSRPSA